MLHLLLLLLQSVRVAIGNTDNNHHLAAAAQCRPTGWAKKNCAKFFLQ